MRVTSAVASSDRESNRPKHVCAFRERAEVASERPNVCFSNRPFEVKRFQAIHHCNVDVARGLVLLFGIGTGALPLWDSKTRRNNLMGGLAINRAAGPSRHANSPHPSSREGHLSAPRWISSFLLSGKPKAARGNSIVAQVAKQRARRLQNQSRGRPSWSLVQLSETSRRILIRLHHRYVRVEISEHTRMHPHAAFFPGKVWM